LALTAWGPHDNPTANLPNRDPATVHLLPTFLYLYTHLWPASVRPRRPRYTVSYPSPTQSDLARFATNSEHGMNGNSGSGFGQDNLSDRVSQVQRSLSTSSHHTLRIVEYSNSSDIAPYEGNLNSQTVPSRLPCVLVGLVRLMLSRILHHPSGKCES
jgi:hypothetical protein